MAQNRKQIVVGLGELLWDCFDDSRRPGGAPANVAFQANQLGCEGTVCSRVGSDRAGDELVEFLAEQGLRTDYIQRDADHPTGRVTVDASVPGSPKYVIHDHVAWDALEFDANTESLMQHANAVCFGTLAQRHDASRETVHLCLEAVAKHVMKIYDVNLRQTWYDRDWIEHSLHRADVVKLNHSETEVIGELLDLPFDQPERFATSIQERFAVSLVCITRAEQGCLLVDRHNTVDVPGAKVDVVDAVGAGDAFTAALIDARLNGWPLESAGRFANAIGGLVTTRPGAMPPLGEEFRQLKQQYCPPEFRSPE